MGRDGQREGDRQGEEKAARGEPKYNSSATATDVVPVGGGRREWLREARQTVKEWALSRGERRTDTEARAQLRLRAKLRHSGSALLSA